jgi:ERCC4-related helicase
MPISIVPREYQQKIFQTAKENNTLVVLPTGLGKTLIALMLSIDRLKKFPGSKIIFLAPTRPLVEQHFSYFKKNLPELFADLQLFTGTVEANTRRKIFQTAEIIFSTPQCIANDLKKGLYSLNECSLLIIDEAHRCLKNYDYTSAVKYYKSQSENILILGLTASPGQDATKVREICNHLSISEIEIRTRDSPDVKSYLQELQFTKIEVPFPKEFEEIRILLKRIFEDKINQLKSKEFLFGPVNKITLLQLQTRLASQASSGNYSAMNGMSLTAQAIKISHAQELLETQTLHGLNLYLKGLIEQAAQKKSRAVQILVKSPEFNACMISLGQLLSKKVEHPKITTISNIIKEEFSQNIKSKSIIFTQYRETANLIKNELSKLENSKPSVFIGQAKKSSGGLSQKEQKLIIEKFKSGEINILIATSIGEEGLDIPEVNSVIFYEPIPSAIRKIQRTGRTARLAPGKLFILITLDTRDVANHYASSAREKKMHKTLDLIKNELKEKQKTHTLTSYFETKPHKD